MTTDDTRPRTEEDIMARPYSLSFSVKDIPEVNAALERAKVLVAAARDLVIQEGRYYERDGS